MMIKLSGECLRMSDAAERDPFPQRDRLSLPLLRAAIRDPSGNPDARLRLSDFLKPEIVGHGAAAGNSCSHVGQRHIRQQ